MVRKLDNLIHLSGFVDTSLSHAPSRNPKGLFVCSQLVLSVPASGERSRAPDRPRHAPVPRQTLLHAVPRGSFLSACRVFVSIHPFYLFQRIEAFGVTTMYDLLKPSVLGDADLKTDIGISS